MNYEQSIMASKKYKHCETITAAEVRWMLPNAVRSEFDANKARRALYTLERDGLLRRLSSDTYQRPSPMREFLRKPWRNHTNEQLGIES